MVSLAELWLPILVSSVFVFIASALAWMALPHHKKDISHLPKESPIPGQTKDLRAGTYMWPSCGEKAEMQSEEFKRRFNEGPWGVMTVWPAKPNFARNLGLVFAVYLVVGIFVAYVTGRGRGPGAEFGDVFQVAGAAAIAVYCFGWMPNAIFFGKPARAWATDFADGLVYGLITGATFAWLWPSARDVMNEVLGGG